MGAQGAGRQQDDRPAAIARLVGVALNFVGGTSEVGIGSQFVDPASRGQLCKKAESGRNSCAATAGLSKLKTEMLTGYGGRGARVAVGEWDPSESMELVGTVGQR